MIDNVENIVLEHLRAIRSDMARMSERMDIMGAELVVIRQHMAGLVGGQSLHDVEINALRRRLDRIERRLELVD
ncbi:hypothetical protein [Aurantimonas sp. 22II-16-19i]|uniref:hypothetical protein n=1 Tax=Aurantimonas sp. 22II-16-19i TaxID=1317114 RepID=UPI0009F96312|nr:hypothetical protein [Aurantimonas sp. 22II-16-19i]